MKYLRLKLQNTAFFDPETRMELSGDDVVPYKHPVGRLTRERIQGGAIVVFEMNEKKAPDPQSSVDEIQPVVDSVKNEPEISSVHNQDVIGDNLGGYRFYTDIELRRMGFFTMRKVATALHVKFKTTTKKEELLQRILIAQNELRETLNG